MMNDINVELLAPAGSYDSLRAAINAGADAVYIGGSRFGARAFADNLDTEKMTDAINFVHLHGKKLFLTVNTLLKNRELSEQLYDDILPLYKSGLDAVIVQDMGVFRFFKNNFPGLDIHASTQMTITGVNGARFLKEHGATRVVTARELSLKELREIHENVDVEIESFIHGALCYCYSGQCLLSSMIGGRSGNRGRCAQPCRLPYDFSYKNISNTDNEKYILSPKDLCTIKLLPDIIEAGVYSLKIEGRMKSPEYVAGVVEIYRKYIDLYLKDGKEAYKVTEKDYGKLTSLYSRSGFTEGYYKEQNGRHMISLKKPSYQSTDETRAESLREKYIKKDKKIPVILNASIKKEQPISITLIQDDISISVSGEIPQLSENRPATKESVTKQLSKFGNTPFEAEKIDIILDDGLFIPVKSLNELRRQATECLIEKITYKSKRSDVNSPVCEKRINNTPAKDFNIVCSVDTMEQFYVAANHDKVKRICISEEFLNNFEIMQAVDSLKESGKSVFINMPYIFRNTGFKSIKNADGYVVRNLDELGFINNLNVENVHIHGDFQLYAMNDNAKAFFCENSVQKTTAPIELNSRELSTRNNKNDMIIVYGFMPLMISSNCAKKTMGQCNHTIDSYSLKDRYKNIFRIKTCCKYCYNVLYNCKPLSLLKYPDEIRKMGFSDIKLNFTFENASETADILDRFSKVFLENRKDIEDISDFTRGHYNRKVD